MLLTAGTGFLKKGKVNLSCGRMVRLWLDNIEDTTGRRQAGEAARGNADNTNSRK